MIESIFNIKSDVDDNRLIVYNLLHRKWMEIPSAVYRRLSNKSLDLKNTKKLEPFFVENTETDFAYRDYLLSCLQFQSTRLNITLMMTMNCNFRCTYCFEHTSSNKDLPEQTIDEDKFCKWVINLIKKYSISEVSICFHGGEPTMCVDKIGNISGKLCDFFEKNHIFYHFTMVSNGYLIKNKCLDTLVAAKIKIVQITVDGDQYTHDKRRFLENGDGTFTTIIDNIMNFPDELKLYLNIVFGHDTYEQVPKLFDYLIHIGLQKKISLIVLSYIKPAKRDDNIINENVNQIQSANDTIFLIKEAISRGFHLPNILAPQVCTIKQKNSFVIHPTGMIYKCISGIENKQFYIGSIDDSDDPFDIQYKILPRIDSTCKSCRYSTICNQGCMYESSLLGHKACQKVYFDSLLPQYIKMLMSENGNMFIYNPEVFEWDRHYVI